MRMFRAKRFASPLVYVRALVAVWSLVCVCASGAWAQDDGRERFNGTWVWNPDLSDKADKQVEKAIRSIGGIPKRPKKRGKEKSKYKYKGGPANHRLYDYLSYEEGFDFHYEANKVRFTYLDGAVREFYSDGRSRSARASDGEVMDYSFASWEDGVLYVEARPRDGGKTSEIYMLIENGARMRVMLELRPLLFGAKVRLTRVFDRKGALDN